MEANTEYLRAIAGLQNDPNIDDKYLGVNGKLLKLIYQQGGIGGGTTVTAGGADFAEVGTWSDGNPNKENRLYRFVTIAGNEREISIATSTSQIVGTSNLKSNVGFLGNYKTGDENDTSKVIVSILGVVPVKTNDSTIKENDRVISDANGYAVKSTNNCGYRVLDVLENGLLSIVVSPNTDMIQRIKTDISNIQNSGKITVEDGVTYIEFFQLD